MVENDQRHRRQWLSNMGVRDVTDRIGMAAIQILGRRGDTLQVDTFQECLMT